MVNTRRFFLFFVLFSQVSFVFAPLGQYSVDLDEVADRIVDLKLNLSKILNSKGAKRIVDEIFIIDPNLAIKVSRAMLEGGCFLAQVLAQEIDRNPDIVEGFITSFKDVSRTCGRALGDATGAGVDACFENLFSQERAAGWGNCFGNVTDAATGEYLQRLSDMFSRDRLFSRGKQGRRNVPFICLKLLGLGTCAATSVVGAVVGGIFFSKKAASAVGEKFSRWFLAPKILEYLQPFEKKFDLSVFEGTAEFKSELQELVENVVVAAKKDEYIAPVTFFGEPGVGKTLMAKVIGAELERYGYKFVKFNISSIRDCENPEDEIRRIFEQAARKKWILFIDEADQLIFQNRSGSVARQDPLAKRLIQKVMDMTGGKKSDKFEGLIISSTNVLSEADPAMLQRFASKVITFPKPDASSVKKIIESKVKSLLSGKRQVENGCLIGVHLDHVAERILESQLSGRLIENFVLSVRAESGSAGVVTSALVDKCLERAIYSSKERGNFAAAVA